MLVEKLIEALTECPVGTEVLILDSDGFVHEIVEAKQDDELGRKGVFWLKCEAEDDGTYFDAKAIREDVAVQRGTDEGN